MKVAKCVPVLAHCYYEPIILIFYQLHFLLVIIPLIIEYNFYKYLRINLAIQNIIGVQIGDILLTKLVCKLQQIGGILCNLGHGIDHKSLRIIIPNISMTFWLDILAFFSRILNLNGLFFKCQQLRHYLFVLPRSHQNLHLRFRCVDTFLQIIQLFEILCIQIQMMYLPFPLVELDFPPCRIITQLILVEEVQDELACFDMLIFWELRLISLRLFLYFVQKFLRNFITFNLLFIKQILQDIHQLITNGWQQFRCWYLRHIAYSFKEFLPLDGHVSLLVWNWPIQRIKNLKIVRKLLIEFWKLIVFIDFLLKVIGMHTHFKILLLYLRPFHSLLQCLFSLYFNLLIKSNTQNIPKLINIGIILVGFDLQKYWENRIWY